MYPVYSVRHVSDCTRPCYRKGENEAGTTSMFSCLMNMPRVADRPGAGRTGLVADAEAFGEVLLGPVNDPTCRP